MPRCGAVRRGYNRVHTCHDSPTLPGQVSTGSTCRILPGLGRAVAAARVAEAEKGGRTAEANSGPGRYFARLSPTHACTAERRSGVATVCQDCHVSLPAASLTASGQPASLPAPAQRLPDRHHHHHHRLDSGASQGVCRAEKETSSSFALSATCRMPAIAHRLPLPAATRPCQPYHWPGTSPIAPRT